MKVIKRYDLERASDRLNQWYEKIEEGEEAMYSQVLSAMEGNMLRLHQEDPDRNSRRALEAVRMCMVQIQGYLENNKLDFTRVRKDDNIDLFEGLRMSFDPFFRDEILSILEPYYDFEDLKQREDYFRDPGRCLMRIEESIELMLEKLGKNGYFKFLQNEGYDKLVTDKPELNFAVRLPMEAEEEIMTGKIIDD